MNRLRPDAESFAWASAGPPTWCRYQTPQSVPGAPQLLAGYSATVLIALLPSLWFKVMDPRPGLVRRQTATDG
ncbi:MAG: hypothetical protein ACT4UQ_03370 [Gammaproteobacteria bacterium]